MKKIKLLFQGDSITDAGRDRSDPHNLGNGYPKYAAELLRAKHPDIEFEFINLGISGNRTGQLLERLNEDAIDLEPDIISILIGVNDVWHRQANVFTTDEQMEQNYRNVLKELRAKTRAKIMILVPFVLDFDDEMRRRIRKELPSVQKIVYKLAEEFADVCIPLDKLFTEALASQPAALYYSDDGVHPNENGAKFIAKLYADAVKKLI